MSMLLRAAALLIAGAALAGPALAAPAPEAPAPEAAAAPAPDAADAARAERPRVRVEMLSDVTALEPGRVAQVGLRFTLEPHWHLYWRHAGDAGLPTEIGFQAPDGFAFGDLRWPLPRRFVTNTGLVGYGYEGEVLLAAPVTVPADALEGETVTLTAHADWLVCNENCIPGRARLDLALPVRSKAAPSEAAPLFARFGATVPGPQPEGLRVEAVRSVSGVTPGAPWEVVLAVTDAGGATLRDADFFPAPAAGLDVDAVQASAGELVPGAPAQLVRVRGRASEDPHLRGTRLDGVLRVERAGEVAIFETHAEVPRLDPGETAQVTRHAVFGNAAGGAPATTLAATATAAQAPALAADRAAAPAPAAPDAPAAPAAAGFLTMLLFAFLGGLILNVMPCVLPVLSIKVLGLVQQAESGRRAIWLHGVAYTAGILASFAVLAAAVVALKASGRLVGWGFQFQEPAFVAGMAALVFAFGLSLFGVFEVTFPGSSRLGGAAAASHGYGGSFMNGVLATVLATPCTAPFLAPALGFALTQPAAVLFGFLLTIGLGLAFPFLLLAAFPQWARWLPRPGEWMTTFKRGMGFLLVATTIWLVDVLSKQVSPRSLVHFLAFLGVLSVGLWIYGHWGAIHRRTMTRWLGIATAAAVVALGGSRFLDLERARPGAAAALADHVPGELRWEDFARTDVEALSRDGHTVFIDFTADWCVTCKVYESEVIDTEPVKDAFRDKCVTTVKADYTNEDPQITQWLKRFERPGVPMYVILPAGRPEQPILLPDLLTRGALLEHLEKAGPSTHDNCAS